MQVFHEVNLDVEGLGLVFYSPHAVAHIADGEDYLLDRYERPSVVQEESIAGRLVGVSLGTPGRFCVRFAEGYPSEEDLARYEFKLRLGIEVRGGSISVRDLYDLLDWVVDCPTEQTIGVDDGFYHLTLLSTCPESGTLGDGQEILVFVQKLDAMPQLRYNGVPTLCP